MEIEKNSKIPFLDILLTHEADGSVSTTVYRKATHTDKYLDYESHHPLSHKLSVVSTLLHRIDTHCSTDSARSVENSRVLQALKVNGYPKTGSSSTCEEKTSINTGMEVNYCTTLCQRGIRVAETGVGSTRC